jgi:hypothetical protein
MTFTIDRTATTQNRDLSQFMNSAIYMLNVSVSLGRSRQRMEWSDLNLSVELVEKLQQAGSDCPRIHLFDGLQAASNKFHLLRKRVQRWMIYASPYWFVQEKDIVSVAEDVRNLLAEVDLQRQAVLDRYEDDRTSFAIRVHEIAIAAGLSDGLATSIMDQYLVKFPTREQVAGSISASVQGPIRVPSLVEQASEEASLAQALADKANADNALSEAAAIAQLQQSWASSIREQLGEAVQGAASEIREVISDCLTKLDESASRGRHSNRVAESVQKGIERLEVLLQFDSSLSDIVGELRSVASSAKGGTDEIAQRVAAIRKAVYNCVDMENTSGRGHKAIAQFMIE